MIKTVTICIAVLLSAVASTTAQYDFARLDALLRDSVQAAGNMLGGGYTLILVRDGEEIFNRSYGLSRENKVIPIASATKWLSGAVIMSLVDDGLLSLDDRVGTYLPSFTGAKGNITVRQLMSHTSGLNDSFPYHTDRSLTLAQAADSIALNVPLVVQPGTVFSYGGTSMQVAGRVAEVAGGKPWDTLFAERIARPLGMSATDYEGLGDTDNPQIGGGAQSSARDYMRFLLMLLNDGVYDGRRVLSEESIRAMHLDQTGGAPIVYTPYEKHAYIDPSLPATRYGIGNWRERVLSATGEVVESASQGAFGFSPWIDRERNLAGVLAVRSLMERVAPTYFAMKQIIRETLDAPTDVSTAAETPPLLRCTPNPCRDLLQVSLGRFAGAVPVMGLYDLSGRLLPVSFSPASGANITTATADVSSLPAGLYLLTVATPLWSGSSPVYILR